MSESPLTLSVPDLGDRRSADAFWAVRTAARRADGIDPFNEQTLLDLASGARSPVVATDERGEVVGAAVLSTPSEGDAELDLVVHPEARRSGVAGRMLDELLETTPPALSAWSHGDHPGARALAGPHGFDPVRTLLQLGLGALPHADPERADGTVDSSGIRIEAFRPGVDEDDWLALNARTFAAHPEQGRTTRQDLDDRMGEDWFEAGDLLIARDGDGRMLGYDWLKLEPGADEAEIYVLGVAPEAAGRGLGRLLMNAGFARIAERGRSTVTLYVEGDNTPALGLYRSLGFGDRLVDVQYARRSGPDAG